MTLFPRLAVCALVFLAGSAPRLPGAEELKPKKGALLSVGVSQIAVMTLSAHVAAYGTVEPAPASADQAAASARLAAPVAGLVVAVTAFEGQTVEKGAPLVQLDRRAADAVVAKAESAVALAEKVFARQQALRTSDSTSDKLWQEAEQQLAAARGELVAGRTAQSLLTVTAPFAGTVTRVAIRPGEMADPAVALVELLDATRLVATGLVPADDAIGLKLGRPVEISTNVANSKVGGAVLYISPHVDEKTGAVTVRASLPANAGFRPGQFVKLRIATEEHGDILAVPVESLVKDPDVGYVVAFVEKDIATQRPVRVGVRDGDFVEIEGEGIKVGQTVVSFGAYALPKMTKVRIITPND